MLKNWGQWDLFLKERNAFIQEGWIQLIKSVIVRTFQIVQKISISNKRCSFELSIHQRILLILYNNKKCFELQISIWEWLLKDHVTLKTEVMMLKIQFCQRNKLHDKIRASVNNALTQIRFNGTHFINARLMQCVFYVWPVAQPIVGEMEMHSVANLATLQTPLATFFPLKKRPNLI